MATDTIDQLTSQMLKAVEKNQMTLSGRLATSLYEKLSETSIFQRELPKMSQMRKFLKGYKNEASAIWWEKFRLPPDQYEEIKQIRDEANRKKIVKNVGDSSDELIAKALNLIDRR